MPIVTGHGQNPAAKYWLPRLAVRPTAPQPSTAPQSPVLPGPAAPPAGHSQTSSFETAPRTDVPRVALRQGSQGAQVKLLQDALVKLGFMTRAEVNTGPGVFGPLTHASLMAFEKKASISVDGRFGVAERAALTRALDRHDKMLDALPSSSLARGDQGPAVRQLQQSLVQAGFMTPAAMRSGPGIYGPKTQAAVQALQRNRGLKQDGHFGAQERLALAQVRTFKRAPAPAPAAPGKPATNPAVPAVAGDLHSVARANKFFITQWGSTRFNSVRGAPDGYNDCAPTSAVMAASSLGVLKDPTPAQAEKAIDHMRDLERGHNTTFSSSTSKDQVIKGLKAVGAKVKPLPVNITSVDQALARGGRVVMAGDPWNAWGKTLRTHGQYLNSRDPGNHACVIFGKTASGKYLMGDPLSKLGVIEVSAAQLARYWHDGSPYVLQVTR
ncbi:MAG: peptidoglycan-binding protein [Pseudomonadota bacterium]